MKRVIASVAALVSIGVAVLMISHFMKPAFPWEKLVLEDASLSSSLEFNPYSDYPPKHRWELGISAREFLLISDNRSYAPILTFSLDLDHRGWTDLPGIYDLTSSRGSDFWHGDDNLGPVFPERIEIKPTGAGRYEVILELSFEFEDGAYKPEKKSFKLMADYDGMTFFVPTWNEPDKVSFPASWHVPSSKPHWTDDDIRTFLGRYIDLSQFADLEIDQSGTASKVHAKPKGKVEPSASANGAPRRR